MRVSGKVISRCEICRAAGKSGFPRCQHKKRKYIVAYRVDGRQKRETIGFNKRDAERRLAEIVSQVYNGTYYKPLDICFKDFAEKWLADYAISKVRERTYKTYQGTIRLHLNPYIGNEMLTNITQEKIQRMVSKLLDKKKPKTVNNTIKQLKTILKIAHRWDYISENPASDIESVRVEYKEMDFLNPEEIRLLLEHAHGPFRGLLLTAILTGLRRSELLALKWGDIDWNSNTIYVRRSIYWKSRKEIDDDSVRWRFAEPKTKRSTRAVVMSPRLKEALEIHRISTISNPYDLVFCNSEGKPVDPDNMIKRDFHPTLAFAGLRKIRFHDLRHTFASLLIAQGESIKFIQSQLGHASAQTTLDRYGHLFPVNNLGVGQRIDDKVFGILDNNGITKEQQMLSKIIH